MLTMAQEETRALHEISQSATLLQTGHLKALFTLRRVEGQRTEYRLDHGKALAHLFLQPTMAEQRGGHEAQE